MAKRGQTNPENVIRRRSYYGFSRDYPAKTGEAQAYLIGDSRVLNRRRRLTVVLAAAALLLLFIISYVLTSAAFYVSEAQPGLTVTTVNESTENITTELY